MTHLEPVLLARSSAASLNVAILAPIVLIEVGLLVYCLADLVRRETVAGGNKLVWAAVIVLLSTLGQILYLVVGRGDT